MTYEEYKNKKKPKENKVVSFLLSRLFTVTIFTMVILIISNYNPKFKSFIKNNVLDYSMDFSYFNNITDKITNIFKETETQTVSKEIKEGERYLDGVKYKIGEDENITLFDSGIVTKIEEKEGYGKTIIIQQSNGYYAWYGNIKPSVKLYDYIESGEVIGIASDVYYYVLLKDDKPILNEN